MKHSPPTLISVRISTSRLSNFCDRIRNWSQTCQGSPKPFDKLQKWFLLAYNTCIRPTWGHCNMKTIGTQNLAKLPVHTMKARSGMSSSTEFFVNSQRITPLLSSDLSNLHRSHTDTNEIVLDHPKGAEVPSTKNCGSKKRDKYNNTSPWNNHFYADIGSSNSISTPTGGSIHWCKFSSVYDIHASD